MNGAVEGEETPWHESIKSTDEVGAADCVAGLQCSEEVGDKALDEYLGGRFPVTRCPSRVPEGKQPMTGGQSEMYTKPSGGLRGPAIWAGPSRPLRRTELQQG